MLPYNNQNEISIEKTQLVETLFQTEKNVMFHELFNEKNKNSVSRGSFKCIEINSF